MTGVGIVAEAGGERQTQGSPLELRRLKSSTAEL